MPTEERTPPTPQRQAPPDSRSATAEQPTRIGKSVKFQGDLKAKESLFIDGEVEGSVSVEAHDITVGPAGKVNASLLAKQIVILGTVHGNVRAVERVQICTSGSVTGDVAAARVVIEDGAYFKGSVEIEKVALPAEAKPVVAEAKPVAPKSVEGVGAARPAPGPRPIG